MVFEIYTFTVSRKVKPYYVRVCIGSEPITMELDTGASLSTIGKKVYRDKLSRYKLCRSNVKLRSYTGDSVPVLGSIKVPVRCNGGESQNIEVLVVKGDRPSLFGRDWLAQIRLDWKGIFRVSESPVESEFMGGSEWPKGFAKFLKEKANLFSRKGTGIKGFSANLKLKEGAKPVYQKARPVPYALCKDVEKEYERLVESDILFPVTYSEWASPAVHVPKETKGSVSLWGLQKGQ